jgi:hypothetical protein
MSLKTCINELQAEGKLDAQQAKRAHDTFDELKALHRQSMGDEAADTAATADAMASLEYQAERDRVTKLLKVEAQRKYIADRASYDGGKGDEAPVAATLATLDHDGKATYDNVWGMKDAMVKRCHAMMERVTATFRRDLLGRMRNPAVMANVVRELFGQDTGDESAKELAAAWARTAEYLRQQFNSAGGAIAKLEDWGLPQSHDPSKVRAATYEGWRDFIGPLLDRSRMIDNETGQQLTDPGLERLLKHIYDTITTGGWLRRAAGGVGRAALGNTRAEHRYLHFDGADKWMQYAAEFGNAANPFETMMGHIDGMARDIALMQRFGPNPPATIKWIQDGIIKDANIRGQKDTLFASAAGGADAVGKLFDYLSGRSAIPKNTVVAAIGQSIRNWIVSCKLGGALVSSFSDEATQLITAKFNGLPMTSAMTTTLKMLAFPEMREAAVLAGFGAGEASRMAGPIHRMTGEALGAGITARMADAALRMSGLSPWTESGKFGAQWNQMSAATLNRGHSFAELPDAYRAQLERYGIDARGWDQIRTADTLTARGATIINPMAIADQELGNRVLRMLSTETAYAVPEQTARMTAMMQIGEPGTIAGELARTAFQFKGFSISMVMNHGRRMASLSPYGKAYYGGALLISTTLLGAFELQLKELIKGRGLRDMDHIFWMQAIAQGSGLGIIGDLLNTEIIQKLSSQAGIQRFSGLAELLAGPAVGLVDDTIRLGIVSPIQDAGNWWEGTPYQAQTSKEAIRYLKNYTPFVNVWYFRAAIERLILDQLQAQIDPNHDRSWDAMEQHAHKQGQDFWWRPGQWHPEADALARLPMAHPPQIPGMLQAAPQVPGMLQETSQ